MLGDPMDHEIELAQTGSCSLCLLAAAALGETTPFPADYAIVLAAGRRNLRAEILSRDGRALAWASLPVVPRSDLLDLGADLRRLLDHPPLRSILNLAREEGRSIAWVLAEIPRGILESLGWLRPGEAVHEIPELEKEERMEILGIDPGFGNFKIATSERGVAVPSFFAAAAGPARTLRTGLEEEGSREEAGLTFHVRLEDGAELWVGNLEDVRVPVSDLDPGRFYGGPGMEALLLAAASRLLGAKVREWEGRAVVGLPVPALLSQEGERLAEGIRRWLARPEGHSGKVNGRPLRLRFREVHVVPQPLGTYYAWQIGRDGRIRPEAAALARSPIPIIDIGRRTLDITVVQRGRVLAAYTGGTEMGVWFLAQRIAELLSSPTGAPPPVERVEMALRAGRLMEMFPVLQGREGTVRLLYDEYARLAAATVMRVIGEIRGQVPMFLAAGGGLLIPGIRERLRDALVGGDPNRLHSHQDPVLSNAIGMARMGRLLWADAEANSDA
jgi:hypothetical protein